MIQCFNIGFLLHNNLTLLQHSPIV